METRLNAMLDELQKMRTESFGTDEVLYRSLGKAMGGLMDARQALRNKVTAGK